MRRHDTWLDTEAVCDDCGTHLESQDHAQQHRAWLDTQSQAPACSSLAPPAVTGEDMDELYGKPYRYGCERSPGHIGPHGALGREDGTFEVTWR